MQIKTIGEVLVPLESTAVMFLKEGKSSGMITDARTSPDVCTAVPKLGSQGTGRA